MTLQKIQRYITIKAYTFLTGLLLAVSSFAQGVVINEFLASNAAINRDPDYNAFSDWIELYNPQNQEVDLSGWHLTDDLESPTKWRIPDGAVVEAGGFFLFFADGKDDKRLGWHANFSLKKSGEAIGLFDADSVAVDTLTFGRQTTDISYGRFPDGGDEWRFFQTPTPGAANDTELYLKTPTPQFSLPEGFYEQPQILELSAESAVIRYTLNGDEPTASSPVYSAPLPINSRAGEPNFFSEIRTNKDPHEWLPDWVPPEGEVFKATVVRARAFRDGWLPSDVATKTFFVDENIRQRYPTLAVISLVSDYQNLFDDVDGIYVPGIHHRNGSSSSGNYFQDWEKPAHIEFFEIGGELGFSQDVGIRIQGGTSPASPQKGLHVIARNEYGDNRINYPIFQNTKSRARDIKVFKRFIIRAWGSTIISVLFNDAFAHRLMEDTDMDLQAYRPAVLFINGEYWGLHELREANKNSWYFQSHYGIDRDDPGVDILQHGRRSGKPYAYVDEGDAVHWQAMMDFINSNDMSLAENYEYIKTQMDVDNFIAYIGHCIYTGKWDWPNNNEASWRPRTPDGKWRWIQYDMETSFSVATVLNPIYGMLGPQYNMVRHVVDGWGIPGFGTYGPHPLFAKLVENEEFKNSFLQWMDARLNDEFAPDRMIALLDEMVAELAPYMPEYRRRWPFEVPFNNDWTFHQELIKKFIKKRPAYVRLHLIDQFGETAVSQSRGATRPLEFTLLPNVPNPFNMTTNIRYRLAEPCDVSINIFDLSGRRIAALLSEHQAAGSHSISWDAADDRGRPASSGVYFVHLQAGDFTTTRKIVLVK